MNDRLKYKVFDKRDNKLKEIKGYTFSLMGMEDLVAIQWTDGFYECSIPLKDLIFCQCTGLKDSNGKLIYEGDIVKYADFDFHDFAFKDFVFKDFETQQSVVIWGSKFDYPAFDLKDTDFDCTNGLSYIIGNCWYIEVIGNIHENNGLTKK